MAEARSRKKKKKTSAYWIHFEETFENGISIVKCILPGCAFKQAFSRTNSTLRGHLNEFHQEELAKLEMPRDFDRKFTQEQKKKLLRKTVVTIILENVAPNKFHGKFFKSMMHDIQSNWEAPSYETINNIIDQIYDELFIIVKDIVSKIKYFCQMSDGWKSKAGDHFYEVGIFFVDGNWKLREVHLELKRRDEEHITAEVLAKWYKSLYSKFGIEEATIVEVIDGGSNIFPSLMTKKR